MTEQFKAIIDSALRTEISNDVISLQAVRGKFWNNEGRGYSKLHQYAYRACFRPELPRFFIEHLTSKGEIVFDPFCGRGTTPIEAVLNDRVGWASDVNPASAVATAGRLCPQPPEMIQIMLNEAKMHRDPSLEQGFEGWEHYYHPNTYLEILRLRNWILEQRGHSMNQDKQLELYYLCSLCMSLLTGNTKNCFSGFSMPSSQAVKPKAQERINKTYMANPECKDIYTIIMHKAKVIWGDLTKEQTDILSRRMVDNKIGVQSAENVGKVFPPRVSLTVTSPPFLDEVDYKQDNWLRCWFLGIASDSLDIWQTRSQKDWKTQMAQTLDAIYTVTKPGGYCAFEVGEVRQGTVDLMPDVVEMAQKVGWEFMVAMIHEADFAKTSHIYGVENNQKGTNTNRITLLRK
jgi:DNA modification methylase